MTHKKREKGGNNNVIKTALGGRWGGTVLSEEKRWLRRGGRRKGREKEVRERV